MEVEKWTGEETIAMSPKILKEINRYVLWFDDPGFSLGVKEWLDVPTGHLFFAWAGLDNYMDITKKYDGPFANFKSHALFNLPGKIRGGTIEEVILNIEDDIQFIKDQKKRKVEGAAEAVKLMRKHIFKDLEIGKHADLQLRVMGVDLKKLCITTKVISNMNWEHVFNDGRKVVWHHNTDNIWEAKGKKGSEGAQSLMYIEDDLGSITLVRDS